MIAIGIGVGSSEVAACYTCDASGNCMAGVDRGGSACTSTPLGCNITADDCGGISPDPCCGGSCCLADLAMIAKAHVFRLPSPANLGSFPTVVPTGTIGDVKARIAILSGMSMNDVQLVSALFHAEMKLRHSTRNGYLIDDGMGFMIALERSQNDEVRIRTCKVPDGGTPLILSDSVVSTGQQVLLSSAEIGGEKYAIAAETVDYPKGFWEANFLEIQAAFWSEFDAIAESPVLELQVISAATECE